MAAGGRPPAPPAAAAAGPRVRRVHRGDRSPAPRPAGDHLGPAGGEAARLGAPSAGLREGGGRAPHRGPGRVRALVTWRWGWARWAVSRCWAAPDRVAGTARRPVRPARPGRRRLAEQLLRRPLLGSGSGSSTVLLERLDRGPAPAPECAAPGSCWSGPPGRCRSAGSPGRRLEPQAPDHQVHPAGRPDPEDSGPAGPLRPGPARLAGPHPPAGSGSPPKPVTPTSRTWSATSARSPATTPTDFAARIAVAGGR